MKTERQKTLLKNGDWRLVYKSPIGMRIHWRRNGRWVPWPAYGWFEDYTAAFTTYNRVVAA